MSCPSAAALNALLRAIIIELHTQKQQAGGTAPNLYPDKQMRQRDAAAKQLHGRLVLQNFVDRSTGRLRPFWGRVHFMCEPPSLL